MLTDIFARRYADYPVWTQHTHDEQRLLVQCIGIAKEVMPYYDAQGKVLEARRGTWKGIHDRLARELGLTQLWQRFFTTTAKWPSGDVQSTLTNEWISMCEMFTIRPYRESSDGSVDRFMKERLSLIELVARERQNEIIGVNDTLGSRVAEALIKSQRMALRVPGRFGVPGDVELGVRAANFAINEAFNTAVNELNVRFQQAGVPLRYHNGFIPVARGEQIENEVAQPFWDAISASQWRNVSIHMGSFGPSRRWGTQCSLVRVLVPGERDQDRLGSEGMNYRNRAGRLQLH